MLPQRAACDLCIKSCVLLSFVVCVALALQLAPRSAGILIPDGTVLHDAGVAAQGYSTATKIGEVEHSPKQGGKAPSTTSVTTRAVAPTPAPSPGERTEVTWLQDPEWYSNEANPLGQLSRFVLLEKVVVTGFVVQLVGTSYGVRAQLGKLPKYKVYSPDLPAPQDIAFEHVATYDEERCQTTYLGPVVMLPPRLPSNLFHLHNDLIMKVSWLMRLGGFAAKDTTLLLFRGNSTEIQRHAQLYDLLGLVLKAVVHPLEEVFRNGSTCFRKLLWSPSMSWTTAHMPGHSKAFQRNWVAAAQHWVASMYSTFEVQIADNSNSENVFLWVNHHSELLPAVERSTHFKVEPLEDHPLERSSVAHKLEQLHKAEVLAGLHGAGLANALYMRSGATLLEVKTSHAFHLNIFTNICWLAQMWYHAIDVRWFDDGGGGVTLPTGFMDRVLADLRAKIDSRDPKQSIATCHGGPQTAWKRFLHKLPLDGTLSRAVQDYCDPDASIVAAASNSSNVVGMQLSTFCETYSRHGANGLLTRDESGTPVIVQKVYRVGRDSTGNALPIGFLSYAVASLAGIRLLKLIAGSSNELTPLELMQMSMYTPSTFAPPAGVTAKLSQAAGRVCRCTKIPLHTCREGDVWQAFQAHWRIAFREALLDYIVPDSSAPRPIDQVATSVVDFAVHVRCGDILKYRQSEYGFLGMSAYRRVLEGRPPGVPLRIRVFMAPTHGDVVKTRLAKDAPFATMCGDIGSGLRRLLSSQFSPAEVTIDNTSETLTVWAHMVFAKRTLCSPSTYCMWPTMAANRGFLTDTNLFFSRSHPPLEGVTHLVGVKYLDMPTVGLRRFGAKEILKWIADN